MPEYRKRGTRTFYKLINGLTIKVSNCLNTTEVQQYRNWMCEESIFGKYPETGVTPCTEQEFNEAKSIAVGRISLEKIEE
jgi:hypothetical protein